MQLVLVHHQHARRRYAARAAEQRFHTQAALRAIFLLAVYALCAAVIVALAARILLHVPIQRGLADFVHGAGALLFIDWKERSIGGSERSEGRVRGDK